MKRFLTFLFLFASIARMSAQTMNFSGTVYDESYKPLPGCYIYTSESQYTMSDMLGHYSIPVSVYKNVDIYYERKGYRAAHKYYSPELSLRPIPDVRMIPDSVVVREANVKAADIPWGVKYITLYTQHKTKRGVTVTYPYVIRFQDKDGQPVYKKEANKLMKAIKNIPAADIVIEGFELESIGNMLDDEGAQRASATIANLGYHDYGKRDTPVYYFKRNEVKLPPSSFPAQPTAQTETGE